MGESSREGLWQRYAARFGQRGGTECGLARRPGLGTAHPTTRTLSCRHFSPLQPSSVVREPAVRIKVRIPGLVDVDAARKVGAIDLSNIFPVLQDELHRPPRSLDPDPS